MRFQPVTPGESLEGKLAYDPWLPVRIVRDQPEPREIEYRNWRRFGAETLLQFEAREGPAR